MWWYQPTRARAPTRSARSACHKGAIFTALHERHSQEISRLVERTLVEHAASSLDVLMRALVEAMVDAHAIDPEMYELLREVPHRADGSQDLALRLRGTLHLALSSRIQKLATPPDLDRLLFVLPHMVDALSHAAVLRRPPQLSLAEAKEEAVRGVLAYLRA